MPVSQYAGVTSSNLCRSSFAALFTSTETGPAFALDSGERRAQRVDVGHVALDELDAVAEARHQRLRFALRDVEEEHPRLLAREAFDHHCADAGTAAGDDDGLAGE